MSDDRSAVHASRVARLAQIEELRRMRDYMIRNEDTVEGWYAAVEYKEAIENAADWLLELAEEGAQRHVCCQCCRTAVGVRPEA